MKTEYVNLFVLFAAITAPIITILTGTLLSITSIGDWLFRKIENKKLKTLKIFAQVCSVVSVFSTIVLIILGVLAFVNTPQIVYPLIVSVATADELTCFIISLALLIAVIIGFTAIEVMRDWINSKNLSAGEKTLYIIFPKS